MYPSKRNIVLISLDYISYRYYVRDICIEVWESIISLYYFNKCEINCFLMKKTLIKFWYFSLSIFSGIKIIYYILLNEYNITHSFGKIIFK